MVRGLGSLGKGRVDGHLSGVEGAWRLGGDCRAHGPDLDVGMR